MRTMSRLFSPSTRRMTEFRPRPVLLFLTLLLASTGCSLGSGNAQSSLEGPVIAVEEPPEPEWRREVSGVTIAGAETSPDRDELALIGAGLDELPASLLEEAGLGLIYRLRDGAIEVEEQTLAFSRGPDIFLIDRTFSSDPTVFDMAALLAHELAHVLQFNRLTLDDVDAIKGVEDADPIAGSGFVREFAATGGWIDRSSDPGSPAWVLPDATGTTAYGATSPEEDMAESISLILTGRVAEVSGDRVTWLEEVLGVDGSVFTAGKLFVPEDAERIDPSQPLFTRTPSPSRPRQMPIRSRLCFRRTPHREPTWPARSRRRSSSAASAAP